MKKVIYKIEFIEQVLGSAPNNTELYSDFIASKAPEGKNIKDEIEAVGAEGVVERTMTVFPKDENDRPFVWDYQLKGMLKDSFGMLRKIPGSKCSKVSAYKKVIDGLIFPSPRRVFFEPPVGEKVITIGECQRPLRASTPMGERSALAISETIPAGSSLTFAMYILKDDLLPAVDEAMAYGKLHGFGQWRNSGCGRYEHRKLDEKKIEMADLLEAGIEL